MPIPVINEKDNVYGKWTVIKFSHSDDGAFWLCRCTCGIKKVVSGGELRHHRSKSCGAKGCKARTKQLTDIVAFRNKIFSVYKTTAKQTGRKFSLTPEKLLSLITDNCHYCGVVPTRVCKIKSHPNFLYNGIDRVNNYKGYVSRNVVTCCRTCNFAKGVMSYKEFTTYLNRVASYRNGPKKER